MQNIINRKYLSNKNTTIFSAGGIIFGTFAVIRGAFLVIITEPRCRLI